MEAFYTLQGEGFHTGKAAYFIRLAGCDVGCVWCDVKESWEVKEDQWKSLENMVREASRFPARMAVITGGEPCMYDLTALVALLHDQGFKVHIETSGAYPLTVKVDWLCVSPKKFMKPKPEMLAKADELKVVVFNNSDFDWAEENAALTKSDCKLFLQPEFEKANKVIPLIVDFVKMNPRWNISLQTHKFLGIP